MRSLLLAAAEPTTTDKPQGLIEVVPGLMIWTLICFAVAFFVLRKFAFGPIQKAIDDRRERIREAVEEADRARAEARRLLEEHRAMLAQAKNESADILADARKVGEAQIQRAKSEAESDRQRRLEETRKQIDAETARALDQIRGEVADLTIAATQRIVGKVLDAEDQRRLIDEAVEELDFSALERGRS
jgi:F-type H+-transporting ATPase subunit b